MEPGSPRQELDALVRREFGLGAAESDPRKIWHTRDPRLPQFEYEWHVGTQKVYLIHLPGAWIDGAWVPAPEGSQARGECIAEHCLTHGMFVGFVQTFNRGFLTAAAFQAQGRLVTRAPDRILQTSPLPVR